MKNARNYEKAVRKLLSGVKKSSPSRDGGDSADPLETLITAVFEENTTAKRAGRALNAINREYVDFNELRVAQPKEIVECIGKDYPDARSKAGRLRGALNGIYYRADSLSTKYMEEMAKRDLRQHLLEIGLSPYAAACVTLLCFGGHAVAVDQRLLAHLKADGYVHPECDAEDAQKFLERVIPLKDAVAAHSFFRKYAQKKPKPLPKKPPKKKAARKKTKKKKSAGKTKKKTKKKSKKKPKKKPKKKAETKTSAKKPIKTGKTPKTKKTKRAKKTVKKKPASRRKIQKKSAKTKKAKKSRKPKR